MYSRTRYFYNKDKTLSIFYNDGDIRICGQEKEEKREHYFDSGIALMEQREKQSVELDFTLPFFKMLKREWFFKCKDINAEELWWEKQMRIDTNKWIAVSVTKEAVYVAVVSGDFSKARIYTPEAIYEPILQSRYADTWIVKWIYNCYQARHKKTLEEIGIEEQIKIEEEDKETEWEF